MNIWTKTLSLFFLPRQKAIECYGQAADTIQEQQLQYLLRKAEKTEWGRKYDYRSIRHYTTFAERVPLNSYDHLKPLIERMMQGEPNLLWPGGVRWFAKSSGTTNDKSKFIPVTPEILHHGHYRGGCDSVALYLRNYPESHFFAHKGLILGGSHAPSPLNASVHCGDLSAVLLQNLSPLVELIRVPRKRIILMDKWEQKIQAIVEEVIHKDVNSLSGVPSWMLVLIQAVLERTGCRYLTEVWPHLEVFFHGGVSFAPYREQYRALIPSDRMHYEETYNASEGFFGIQDDPSDPSLLLMLDYSIFYEFIPLSELDREHPTVLPLHQVKVGTCYAMVITTAGGLWRYLIGDTVCFTSVRPYKFIITGRTRHYINAFGEELMVHNADRALAETCRQTGAKVREYTAAPLFLLDRAKGRHQWLIEFEQMPDSVERFAALLDQSLQAVNSDYEAKRYQEISLQPLEVIVARPGLFYDWLARRGKLGGQHKIPRLANDRKLFEELLALQHQKV